MRLGLISDIHGNRLALGPEPASTLDLLTSLPGVRFVRGNTDRYVVTGERPPPHRADVEADPELWPLFVLIESHFSWTRGCLSATGWRSCWPGRTPTSSAAATPTVRPTGGSARCGR